MSDNKNIYGPTLETHENQAAQIAVEGLRIMAGKGAVAVEAPSTGPDTSKSELEGEK